MRLRLCFFFSVVCLSLLAALLFSCSPAFEEINGLEELVEGKNLPQEDEEEAFEEEQEFLSGVLIDAAVEGVTYNSSTSGRTNVFGTFFYQEGDTVIFSIGGIILGSSLGQVQITALDLVETKGLTDRRTVNILRLLQTLDDDSIPSNGITISESTRVAAASISIDFDQPTADFSSKISSDLATLTASRSAGPTRALISSQQAVSHFIDTVNSSETGAIGAQITVVKNAPTASSLSASSVAENEASGTTVGTLSSTDVDNGDEHIYSLVPGTGDTNNASFSVSGSRLLTAASFDFETKSSYSLRVGVMTFFNSTVLR